MIVRDLLHPFQSELEELVPGHAQLLAPHDALPGHPFGEILVPELLPQLADTDVLELL
jgi:hypothetical protein